MNSGWISHHRKFRIGSNLQIFWIYNKNSILFFFSFAWYKKNNRLLQAYITRKWMGCNLQKLLIMSSFDIYPKKKEPGLWLLVVYNLCMYISMTGDVCFWDKICLHVKDRIVTNIKTNYYYYVGPPKILFCIFLGSPKFWYALISPSRVAVTMTKPQAVACVVWFALLLLPILSSQDQEEDQEDVDALPTDIEESPPPYLIEEGSELNDSPIPDSVREIWAGSWSSSGGGVAGLWSNASPLLLVLFFLGRGGRSLLLKPAASSWVGDAFPEGGCCCCCVERFECLLECCTGTGGGSPFIVPGHGIATETSLHWKCSWEFELMILFFPAPEVRGSSRFQTYTWESSLAHMTYFPFGLNEAPIWLLVFRKPVCSQIAYKALLTRRYVNRNWKVLKIGGDAYLWTCESYLYHPQFEYGNRQRWQAFQMDSLAKTVLMKKKGRVRSSSDGFIFFLGGGDCSIREWAITLPGNL